MLLDSVKVQMKVMFKRKLIWVAFYIVLLLVLLNYLNNVDYYNRNCMDVIFMDHPARITLLSGSSMTGGAMGMLFFQLYPLLVILPAGFSLAYDYESGEALFLYSRVGGKNYYIGKLIAVFLTTALIFMIPLLLEVGMNFLSYPKKAMGIPGYGHPYESFARNRMDKFLYGGIEIGAPYLASFVGICVLGITSGILAMFTVAISSFKVRFKVLLFLPVYVLLYGLVQLDGKMQSISFTTQYQYYLQIFEGGNEKNGVGFISVLVLLTVFSVVIMARKGRKELL